MQVAVNTEWAVAELKRFANMTQPTSMDGLGRVTARLPTQDAVLQQAGITEQVLDRVSPGWRQSVPHDLHDRWAQTREAAVRARALLEREGEVQAGLGDDSPTLSAGQLHPWAWEGAQSMWRTGHYRQGVVDALKRVNYEAQNKAGRRELSETKLFQQLFSSEAPQPGKPRLRLMDDDGGDTFKNVHRGAMNLADGLFTGVRNPVSHNAAETEANEQEALEQLAAVSVLARWVDSATVVSA